MKKVLTIILLVLCFLVNIFAINNTAIAEIGEFIMIPKNSEVYFYDNDYPSFSKLFKLPSTYYVKLRVVNSKTEDNDFYFIHYNGKDGLLKKTEISNSEKVSNIDKPYYQGTDLNPNKDLIYLKKLNSTISDTVKTLQKSEEFTFISYLKDAQENIWYYVKIGNDYGYVLNTDTSINNLNTNMDLSSHANSVPKPEIPNNNDNTGINNPTERDTSNNLLNFALAIGIAIPTIILIIMVFKPQGKAMRSNKKRYRSNVNRNDNYDDYDDRYYDDRPTRR